MGNHEQSPAYCEDAACCVGGRLPRGLAGCPHTAYCGADGTKQVANAADVALADPLASNPQASTNVTR